MKGREFIMPSYRIQGEITREVVAFVEADTVEEATEMFERLQCDDLNQGSIVAVVTLSALAVAADRPVLWSPRNDSEME
jgi:hypothetical protein